MANVLRVPRPRVTRRAALTLVSVAALMCGWPALAAGQGPEAQRTAHVGDRAESWFASSPVEVCPTPLGCPPEGLPSPYPADTLHVGVAGGQETARTYVVPDLPSVAAEGTGTMTLPVATDTLAGTRSPETAAIRACLVKQPVPDGVDGSLGPAPVADCTVGAEATYHAVRNVFTVDLTPFLAAWAAGRPPDGIALVPDPAKARPTDAWHVAFNGRHRAGVAHIASVVTYAASALGPPDSSLSATPPGTTAPAASAREVAQHLSLAAAHVVAAPRGAAPQVASRQPTTVPQQRIAFTRGFAYPLAFLTPLALLAGAVWLARLFTRDATPLGLR